MHTSRFLLAVLFGFGVLFSVGCSQPAPALCSPTNCHGCCSGNQCLGGTVDSACGSGGARCIACSPNACFNATCMLTTDAGPADAGGGDAGSTDVDSQLAAVRAAADVDAGAVMLPVDWVLVTYLKPLVPDAGATDPAGFFVQNSTTGPALFVAVDPSTVTGGPVAMGDQISFTVTQVQRVGALRVAAAISNLAWSSRGNPVGALIQDVSAVSLASSTDIDGYESKLISLTGQVVSQTASAGGGYRAVAMTSVGTPAQSDGGSSMQLRMVASVANTEDLSPGCSVALSGTPLWRYNARAQPSAFVLSDFTNITCPAPRLQTARASAANTVVATFDRNLFPASVTTSAFTISGLTVSGAALTSAFRVTLTTDPQTVGASYTLVVASTIADVRGTPIDPSATMATFTGFDPGTDGGSTFDGGQVDSGVVDAGSVDAGVDAGVVDAGSVDAGAVDSGVDAGAMDAGADAGIVDAGTCTLGHLVISEIRTRGAGGASDEFVELYNPTSAPVTLDSTWTLSGRSSSATSYTVRYTGTGVVVPGHGHALITGTTYAQSPAGDDALLVGLTDASSLVLYQGTTAIDAVCFGFDATTLSAFSGAGYVCNGMPASNLPHDNSNLTASNVDVSIERLPGGALGNCKDSQNNAADFINQTPATPNSTQSPLTP